MTTRTETVMTTIRTRIANAVLGPGDRLPSIRHLAKTMKVSPSTVVEAYDRLTAEGMISPRRGSGFYVSRTKLPPIALTQMGESRERDVDPLWVSRQSLDADNRYLMPGCGWLPADWMPNAAIRKNLRVIARSDDAALSNYGSTRGSTTLRRLLLTRFAEEGLNATMEQIILASSGTQAIDLICRLFLRPGDTVLLDDPCYFNFQALLRAHQVKIVSVPYTPTGPNLSVFEQTLGIERPRLYMTNSALHNPTGASLSLQTAHRVLSLAGMHDLTIVEDDIFADFESTLSPRLSLLDGLNRVIRIGSFSKTLSASLRCGYIAGRKEWIENLIDLQVATNFGGPSPFAADLIANILAGGTYRKHMGDVRQRLDRARKLAIDRLAPLGIKPWLIPQGGFYLWCHLPEGYDSAVIAQWCMQDKIVLAPGNVFSASQSAGSFLRFNVAQLHDERIFTSLRKAMDHHRAP